MDKNSKIYIAGHQGLVGSAIIRNLQNQGYVNLVVKTRQELDLLDDIAVIKFFKKEKPKYIFLAAAKVGGIMANNSYPAEFIYQNLKIQNSIIHNAYLHKTKKLLFLGSSCIYPKFSKQPIKEKYLMSGELEPTNRAYAIAKIAGIEMCRSYNKQYKTNFISAMPTNLYGPNDNFDLENSHVLPALIKKFHEAKIKNKKEITLWGTGKPKREFLYVDDLADACVFLMQNYNDSDIINIGTGEDLSIKKLAENIKKIIGFKGNIKWDYSKPDGTPKKLLDVSKLHKLGLRHKIKLKQGIKITYEQYKNNDNKA
ncbi:GDP-L-fucose synthase [Candidatus Parcubacteria bacterium]|nr:GDP-L-fucose synthase [Candidatus Parcubacteria bacterium]